MKTCKKCGEPFQGKPGVYKCDSCLDAAFQSGAAAMEAKLQARIDHEPDPLLRREICGCKLSIELAQQLGDMKIVLDGAKRLMALEKARFEENRKPGGRSVEASALTSTRERFTDIFISVYLANPCRVMYMQHACQLFEQSLSGQKQIDFRVAWTAALELLPDLCGMEPECFMEELFVGVKSGPVATRDDYDTSPAYIEQVRTTGPGRFRELIALCAMNLETYRLRNDSVLVSQFSAMIVKLMRGNTFLNEIERDYLVAEDVDAMQTRLQEHYSAPPGSLDQFFAAVNHPEFEELVRSCVDDAWWLDLQTIMAHFGDIVRDLIWSDVSREDILEKYLGKVDEYRMPRAVA